MKSLLMNLKVKHFSALSLKELYDLLALRQLVFVVEQNAAYQDNDGNDEHCWHLWIEDEETCLAAYGRIVPAGLKFDELSIGRILTAPSHRRHGFGRAIVKSLIETAQAQFGACPIRISAQLYLRKFYEDFGFVAVSEVPYAEDGIPHIEMLRPV